MAPSDEPAIRLCGGFEVTLEGRSLAHALPGRQGRLLLAYLVCHRDRAVTRDELADLLWPERPPASPEDVLGALVSKLRRVLGADALPGRQELRLELPPGAAADVELAAQEHEAAAAALSAGDPAAAVARAQRARALLAGEFLPGYEQPWVRDCRRQLIELGLDSAETAARAGIALGGASLAGAERAARELVAAEPLRERGYQLLMETLAARDDQAGALGVYEELRIRLRDELGIAPGAATRALHERLLHGEAEPATPPEPRPPPREERKLVTVLAAQLEAAGPQTDPEDLRAAASEVQSQVAGELERLGATLHSAVQGTVIALFGVPHAHEDDAERAVRTGAGWLDRGLVARARVASCELLVIRHADGALEIIGAAIETATRIARNTPPGTLHVDAATFQATRHAFAYLAEPFGGSWRLRGPAPLEHHQGGRFVGRRREVSALVDLLHAVREERRPQLVMLTGQAGIGKSRLVDELVSRAGDTAVYRGRCLPYGEGITFWPLREILWAAAGIQFGDEAAVAAQKLRGCVLRMVGEAGRVADALAVAAGISIPENPVERLAPGSVAEEIGLAWPAFLSALASREPVLVVVEDLHWAEEPLLDMLELMLARASGSLLLIATARPEFAQGRAGWSSLGPITQIVLEPLTEPETEELAAALLPDAAAEVRGAVVATAEGNPFFVEELVRHIADHGEPSAIPNTVRALIAARVDGLPETEKHVLQDAAVVGRTFWRSTLDAVEARPDLSQVLTALERRGLVVTRPGSELPGETELAFRHGLIREVVYRSIPRARRCRAHAAVGDWMERLAGDRREEFVELLAHHYEAASAPGDASLAWPSGSLEHAELKAKAVRALVDAGDAARRRMTLAQALRYAHRAQALASSDDERLVALELEARTHHTAARGDEARVAYAAAIEMAEAIQNDSALRRLRAYALLLCIRYQGTLSGEGWQPWAVRMVREGLASDPGTPSFERGTLLLARGWCNRRWLGRSELVTAKQDTRQAIAIARRVGAPELLTAAMEVLTWLVFEEGCCEAEHMAERLVSVSVDVPDRGEAHESLVTAAMSFRWAGRFDRAAETAARFADREAELGGHRALHSAAAQALFLAPTGQIAELGRATSRVPELAAEEGERTCKVALVALAGHALWQFETLHADTARATVELLERLRPPRGRSLHDYSRTEVLRPVLGLERAHSTLEQFEPPGGHAIDAILALRVRLPVLVLVGDEQALEEDLSQARRLAVAACAPALGWIADWAAALVARTDDTSSQVLAAAASLERHGERYTAARLLLDAAGKLADAELAARAAESFQALGALASVAAARALAAAGGPAAPAAATAAAAQAAATVARTSEL